jgi:Zn-dependent M28 family amino/carboxypeptidase
MKNPAICVGIGWLLALPLAAAAAPDSNGPSSMNPSASTDELRRHVNTLAGEIGERNVYHPQRLRRAAEYLRAQWAKQGYRVTAQDYRLEGETWSNLEVSVAGGSRRDEIVVIGAHYDSVSGSPGANDNASGVAALLELSRLIVRARTARTLRFVAFVNEEPPFFPFGDMGSRVYARAARARGEDIRAMLSLETIGYYSEAPGSQQYPPLLRWFYPDRGNFIGFVANFRSRALMKRAVTAFRAASDFPLEHIATFASIPGVDWSDHRSFWEQGYPAFMVTDTALYRYPHYHSAQDTPDKLDYARLARVTDGLRAVVEALANAD